MKMKRHFHSKGLFAIFEKNISCINDILAVGGYALTVLDLLLEDI